MSQVITFYSYKGGVGRSMALANIVTLLSQWGYRTLVLDWDLEAPGLQSFFKPYCDLSLMSERKGLLELLLSLQEGSNPLLWKDLITPIFVPEAKEPIHFISAGKQDSDYFNRVQELDFQVFYEEGQGGFLLEEIRDEWKESYDFVLIDSRTGVTDLGGVCTIHMPDLLVAMFTATEHGFNGILDVAERAVQAQRDLPFDRLRLNILPIPARFDSIPEFRLSQKWKNRFASGLEEIYKIWLPPSVDRKNFIDQTKIPYVSYFSFGEKLPVIEQGLEDPAGLGYPYETLAALIAKQLKSIETLMENRDQYVKEALKGYKQGTTRNKVFVSYSHKDKDWLDRILVHLKVLENEGIAIHLWDDTRIKPGMKWRNEIQQALSETKVAVLFISTSYLASDFILNNELVPLLKAAEEDGATIIPVILKPSRFIKNKELSVFKPANDPNKPLIELSEDEQDKILLALADRIEELIHGK